MAELTENARKKLGKPNFGHLATLMDDGSPHVSPVWVDVEDGSILVNTAVGRVKERNVRRDPRVAISITENEDPYDKIHIRGRVVDFVEGEEADRHIDKLAKKYLDADSYPYRTETERRVILRISPTVVYEGW